MRRIYNQYFAYLLANNIHKIKWNTKFSTVASILCMYIYLTWLEDRHGFDNYWYNFYVQNIRLVAQYSSFVFLLQGGKYTQTIFGNVFMRVIGTLSAYMIMIDTDVTMLVTLFTRDYNKSFTLDENKVFTEMLLNIFLTSLIVVYVLSFILIPIN